MPAKVVHPTQLWDEIRYNIESVKQDFAAEVAAIIIGRTPVDTGRLVRSINLNNGKQAVARQDRYRGKSPEASPNALRARKKAALRQQARKRVKNSSYGRPWWIVASAPYASYVNDGTAKQRAQRFMNISRQDVEQAKRKALANNRRRA